LPHAHLLSRQNRSLDDARSKKQSKSTLAHDAVADALLHKHHLIIYIGAGPIQLIYGSPLQLVAGRYLEKILFSTMFWWA